jgi:hypothetical protein
VIGTVGKIRLGGGEREYTWQEMIGGSEKGYDMEVSGGQVCGSGRWKGSGRCDRQRREMEWGTDGSGRMSGKREW